MTTDPETLATLAARLAAIRADIDAALIALAPALPPKPAPNARPTCALCSTDADAPTVERRLLVPHTVHAACVDACDRLPEPGDACDRVDDFIADHLPDCEEGCLRHNRARADLEQRHPGIFAIAAALKAAQPTK